MSSHWKFIWSDIADEHRKHFSIPMAVLEEALGAALEAGINQRVFKPSSGRRRAPVKLQDGTMYDVLYVEAAGIVTIQAVYGDLENL